MKHGKPIGKSLIIPLSMGNELVMKFEHDRKMGDAFWGTCMDTTRCRDSWGTVVSAHQLKLEQQGKKNTLTVSLAIDGHRVIQAQKCSTTCAKLACYELSKSTWQQSSIHDLAGLPPHVILQLHSWRSGIIRLCTAGGWVFSTDTTDINKHLSGSLLPPLKLTILPYLTRRDPQSPVLMRVCMQDQHPHGFHGLVGGKPM